MRKKIPKEPVTALELWGREVSVEDPTAGTPVLDEATGYQGHHACSHCGVTFGTTAELHKHLAKDACGAVVKKHQIKRARYFDARVDVPSPTPAQQTARSNAMVFYDTKDRVALEVAREGNLVTYAGMGASAKIELEHLPVDQFEANFRADPSYPTGRAAQLLINAAVHTGASAQAIKALECFVSLPPGAPERAAAALAVQVPAVKSPRKPRACKALADPAADAPEIALATKVAVLQQRTREMVAETAPRERTPAPRPPAALVTARQAPVARSGWGAITSR